MWGWIKPLLDALLAFFNQKAGEAKTIQDENTPQSIRDKWNAYLRDKLRSKNGGN